VFTVAGDPEETAKDEGATGADMVCRSSGKGLGKFYAHFFKKSVQKFI